MDVTKDDLYKRFLESNLNRCICTLRVFGKSCFNAKKFHWRNIFFIEMFIFANFLQKVDFER